MIEFFSFGILFFSGVETRFFASKFVSTVQESMIARSSKGYQERYKDKNSRHLEAAQCWDKKYPSVLPLFDIDKLALLSELKSIQSSELLIVSPMRYSRPLLQEEAVQILEEIARRFQKKLQSAELPMYRIVLTSGTRSIKSQSSLEKVNDNAATESAHWYGYTFDISFGTFVKRQFWSSSVSGDVLKELLSEVIWEMREENTIWVIPEYGPSCFHITLRCPQ